MKKLLLICALLCAVYGTAQDKTDGEQKGVSIVTVDADAVRAIAKESTEKYTLFYTFGIWCEPCILHLPTAMKLAKEHNLNFYVLLVDSQGSERLPRTVSYLLEQDKDMKIAILADSVYGERTAKRNKKFVREITPPQFEAIDDFSKYILLNREGKVIMVTNYKDNEGNDWRDDSKMVQKRIVPLLL